MQLRMRCKTHFNVPVIITATVVTVLVAMIILGGVRRIATASSVIVPFMAIGYVATSIIILVVNYDKLPAAIALIIHSAFNPQAALGGAVGFTVMKAIQSGVARGIFSNESGLGSAPIAAAAVANERARSPRFNFDDRDIFRYHHRMYDDGISTCYYGGME